MGKISLPYLNSFKDRYGKMRFYYRRNGMRTSISGEPHSPEFMENYRKAHEALKSKQIRKPVNTFGGLVLKYYQSPEFCQPFIWCRREDSNFRLADYESESL